MNSGTMSKPSHYIGLTIGPIFSTLDKARSTRELWAASYLFSHLMRLIVKQVKKIGGVRVLTPSLKVDWNNDDLKGIGLYPDRMILKTLKGEEHLKEVHTCCEAAKKELLETLIKVTPRVNKANIQQAIRAYLQTYLILLPIESDTEEEYLDKELSDLLSTAELQLQLQPFHTGNKDYIKEFLLAVKRRREAAEKIFGNNIENVKALEKIATVGLEQLNRMGYEELEEQQHQWLKSNTEEKVDDSTKWIQRLKTSEYFNDDFRTHHKYIAIVYADGDNVGKTFGELETDEDFTKLSDDMAAFGQTAAKKIKMYGGLPIYIGGDDLLFFAPVKTSTENIFGLAKALNQLFQKHMEEYERPDLQLSFGISISYYKHPMNEALQQAQNLLFQQAKGYKNPINDRKKNALAFRILKHSGQYFEQILQLKCDPIRDCLDELMQQHVEKEGLLLNSITYTLDKTKKLLEEIGTDEQKVHNFLANSFDEDVHKTATTQTYFNILKRLIVTAHKQYALLSKEEKAKTSGLDTVYTILRTVNFLKRKDTTDD